MSDLKPEILSAELYTASSLELKVRAIVEGFLVGLHKSPFHGFSSEFSQHRQYNQGDQLKDIDWKVYARNDKYFIRQFEEETNLIARIFIDSSNSMNFKESGKLTKFEYAVLLAASLSYLLIRQKDAVGLTVFSDEIKVNLESKSSKIHLKTILTKLTSVLPEGKGNFKNLENIALNLRKRGLIIIISDLLDNEDDIIRVLKLFSVKNNDVILFQVMDEAEVNFPYSNDVILKDLESLDEMYISSAHIKNIYKKSLENFRKKIVSVCKNNKVDYNFISTETDIKTALNKFYFKRSKLF